MMWPRVPLAHVLACASRLHKNLWKWLSPDAPMRRPDLFYSRQAEAAFEAKVEVTQSPTNFVVGKFALPNLLYVLLSCVYISSACLVYDSAHGIPNP
jgi:hypothetical protein